MKKKRKKRRSALDEMQDNSVSMVKTGMILGVGSGSLVIGESASGPGKLAEFMPMMGSIQGASTTMKMLKKLKV